MKSYNITVYIHWSCFINIEQIFAPSLSPRKILSLKACLQARLAIKSPFCTRHKQKERHIKFEIKLARHKKSS